MATIEGSLTLKTPKREPFFLPFAPDTVGECGDRRGGGTGDRGPYGGTSDGGGEVRFVEKVSPETAVPIVLVDCREPAVDVSIVEFR
jgi:hypothetical protein